MIAAEVYLWGTRIGVVEQADVTDIPRFNYDKNFLKSRIEVSPIVMPLSEQIYTFPMLSKESFKGLPGLLADSLPDKYGTKLIERYLSEQGRSINNLTAVERLCYTGKRGMGALEYIPARDYLSASDSSIDIGALVRLASDILSEKESVHVSGNDNLMEQIINVGTSAGGARAKAIIAWNKETNDIRSGQIDAGNRDHGNVDDGPAYTRIEYAYYLMAKAAGIDMNECNLYKENGAYHFMTKRFDREGESGTKLHMQSLGAMAHFDYNEPGMYSYEQAADIIYRIGANQKDVEKLYRRMIFNVLTRNQDDHVKNISFLMDKRGQWKISPAYDITFAYDNTNRWLAKHQMSVNGKLEDINLDDMLQCAKRMNISKRKADKIIDEVLLAANNWEVYAKEAFVREEIYEKIKRSHIHV